MQNLNVEPIPSSDLTLIQPPIHSHILLHIVNPKPVPF